jgi:hypothetical protein
MVSSHWALFDIEFGPRVRIDSCQCFGGGNQIPILRRSPTLDAPTSPAVWKFRTHAPTAATEKGPFFFSFSLLLFFFGAVGTVRRAEGSSKIKGWPNDNKMLCLLLLQNFVLESAKLIMDQTFSIPIPKVPQTPQKESSQDNQLRVQTLYFDASWTQKKAIYKHIHFKNLPY